MMVMAMIASARLRHAIERFDANLETPKIMSGLEFFEKLLN